MYKFKTYSELEFHDDYLFSKIMQNEEICKDVIKTLLNIEVEKVEYIDAQKEIDVDYSAHGIRLDVFVKDTNRIFNLEMQTFITEDLTKRARYYQSLIDLHSMQRMQNKNNKTESKKGYSKLQESYIIFICKEDPFDFGIPIYTFEHICKELFVSNEKMNDKTHRIFYNASAWEKCENLDLRNFLKYVYKSEINSELTNRIENEVISSKYNELWRIGFMSVYDWAMHEIELASKDMAKDMAQDMAKNMAKDLAQDMAKDMAQDMAKDLAQDMAKDLAQTMAKDILKQGIRDKMQMLISMGITLEQVAQVSGLSLEEIKELQ